MAMTPVKMGVIGCGNISNAYFSANKVFEMMDIVACADLDLERAKAKAEEHGIARACSVDELLADPEIEIVINLTIPKAHGEVNLKAIAAGKHVYVEKPFAVTREDGKAVMDAAAAKGLLTGGAPDTFMGEGGQECRRLIDKGAIGEPVAATAFLMGRGHEGWHPSPEFYYEVGGGPLFDMGPYYITALVNLMGPIKSVSSSARITFPQRTIMSEPKKGKVIDVETPTHIAGTIDFVSGAICTLVMSFDVKAHKHTNIEIYGSEGTLQVPDPNGFGGPVNLFTVESNEWTEMPLTLGHPEYQRGVGAMDMGYALRSGRSHRASGALAFHVLDAMQSFLESAEQGKRVDLTTTCERPTAIPDGLAAGILDE